MGEIVLYSVQLICIFLTIFGIVTLLNVDHNKAASYLMIGLVACLVSNACAYLMLTSNSPAELYVGFKVKYMANLIFYMFFTLFVITYLRIKVPMIFINFGALLCILDVFLSWTSLKIELAITNVTVNQTKFLGKTINYVRYEHGPLHWLLLHGGFAIHTMLVIYLIKHMVTTNRKEVVRNYSRLLAADVLIIIALFFNQTFDLPYDFLPIIISLASLVLIIGVIKARLFKVSELGRDWLFENMSDGFIVLDKDYGYIDSNPVAQELFPELKLYNKHQLVDSEITKVLFDEDPQYYKDGSYYTKQIKNLSTPRKKNKRLLNVEVEGYSIVFSDITKIKTLLDEVEDARERAEEANRTKSAFLSNMSHEIRTPMNAIVGMTEILLRSDLTPVDRGYLKNIKSSGESLINIINDILDFSKIEAGKIELVPTEYDLLKMINDLNMIFMNRVGRKKIVFLCDLDPNIPKSLFGDGLRIRQIIINLVNNAIKFTESGYVRLSVSLGKVEGDNAEINFSIRDSGQGIAEDELNKLFKSFSQVDIKKNRAKEGTGLGLAISKQLVELMGGHIGVDSEYGSGSNFYFNIFQKVIDPARTLYVDDVTDEDGSLRRPIVSANVEGEKEQMVRKLCETYNVTYIDFQTLEYQKNRTGKLIADYLFTDYDTYSFLKDRTPVPENMKICVVVNPMIESTIRKDVIAVNAPLCGINFCSTLNRSNKTDIIVEAIDDIDDIDEFTAPEARILVVDDNSMNLKVCEGLLKPLNMWIDTADSGKSAIDMCKRIKFDIIFMDHMMPVMDGVEATHHIRDIDDYYKELPIIALTANAVSDAKEMFIKEGLTDFVPKPIEVRDLFNKVKCYLPKGKIVPKKNAASKNKANTKIEQPETVDNIVEQEIIIDPIPGINIADGIKYTQTKENLVYMLGEYYKVIDLKANIIRQYLAEERIKDYTIEVHGLKSTSRLIGANELSEQFFMLEKAGNAGDLELINSKTEEVLEYYESFKEFLFKYGALQAGDEEISNDELIGKLQAIADHMNNFELDEADAVVGELEKYKMSDECIKMYEKLRIYVSDVDADKVTAQVEEMINLLKQ